MSIFDSQPMPMLDHRLIYLVVDDFEPMRKITVNQLTELGAKTVLKAKDGMEALRVLKSQPVDVVLTDWNMPVMTGLELLKAIRADQQLFTLPVIMITAEAERVRIQQAIDAGVTSMLLKPYSNSQLLTRIQKGIVAKPRRQVVAAPASAGPTPAPVRPEVAVEKEPARPTILVVDDTPDNLMLLSQLLRDEFLVKLAQSGAKALEICCSDSPPDLVLLDIMMPGMDGFEVAKRMREHPAAESIPVIFVTAMTEQDARVKGLDLGAIDFITKPIDPGVLKPRVRNFMRYVQMRKDLQSDYDSMVSTAQLREDVEHITRHDMKGPLAGVIGLIQALAEDDSLGKKQLTQLRMAEETALQVLNMINLSSELFKIESGSFKLDAQPVKVGDILRRLVEIDRVTYKERNLSISVDTDTPVGTEMPQALGDAMLCYSLFQNLLKNACEAAPEGTTIAVKLLDQSPLNITIQNRGAVPAGIRNRFFEKYVTSGKKSGTGLGTYSAKLLTEAQGGSIKLDVVDETDMTMVTVTLPRAVEGFEESVASTSGPQSR